MCRMRIGDNEILDVKKRIMGINLFYLLLILLCFFSSCSNKKEVYKESIKKEIVKAYINLSRPLEQTSSYGYLFYECLIENKTNKNIDLKFPHNEYDDLERKNLFLVLNNNDTINLYTKFYVDRDFIINPGEAKKIDFSLDNIYSLFKSSNLNNYLLFQDSIAFVTKDIILHINDSIFKFTKNKEYVMEHRWLESFYAGEGMKI